MAELDLATLANWAQIFGMLTVAGGVVFALWQIRHGRQQRRDMAALEFIRGIQTPEFLKSEQLVWDLPGGMSGEEFCKRGPEAEHAAVVVGSQFEALGVMVYRRMIPLDVVQDIVGTTVRVSWRNLKGFVELTRRDLGSESPYEWFQWLTERMEQREPAYKKVGAHNAFRDWRP